MNIPHYTYLTNDFYTYEFYSYGPKGSIKKVVLFSKLQENPTVYNLGFGDEDSITGVISDSVTSNNQDRDKVLATVANTIIDFSNRYGNHYIFVTGSTPVRTRLYQIGIAGLLDEIHNDFVIYGIIDDVPYQFQKNVNYEAFLVKRK